MIYILFGKPLFFWLGLLAYSLLLLQIYLGMMLMKGKPVLIYHRLNAGLLFLVVTVHFLLAISLYIK